jgi:hypothetical protein
MVKLSGPTGEGTHMLALLIDSETRGELRVLLDPEDWEKVSGYGWCVNSDGYAVARVKGVKGNHFVYMHKLIVPRVPMIDHANGNRLDNRKSNLRPASYAENMMNSRKRKGTTSRWKGVSWSTRAGKWVAQYRGRHLGYFNLDLDAADAYDAAAVAEFPEFARLNNASITVPLVPESFVAVA